jgi:hypothetical protein
VEVATLLRLLLNFSKQTEEFESVLSGYRILEENLTGCRKGHP